MDTRSIHQPTPQRYVTNDGRTLRAIERAHSLGHNARHITDTHYKVYSQRNDGTEYDVLVTSSGLRCSCKSAQYGKVCKHVAKVGLRLQREGRSETGAPLHEPEPPEPTSPTPVALPQPKPRLEDFYPSHPLAA